jgi:hypothetical protein
MSCAAWEPDLIARARGEQVAPGLDAHLRACPACAERLALEQHLSDALAAAAAADAGLRPPERVAAALRRALPQPPERRRAGGVRLLLAAAAALAVAVLPLLERADAPLPRPPAPDSRVARFLPLPGAEPLVPGEPVQLVRVGLSAAAFEALGWPLEMESRGLVETELILGPDGVARALRLPAAGTRAGGVGRR